MVVFFEEQDIVSFGNYLLSNVVESFKNFQDINDTDQIPFIDRLNMGVTHADLENWAYSRGQIKQSNEG